MPIYCVCYCKVKWQYNNKTTRVWFLREQKHTSDGLWPRKPSRVCFCSLRNHTSVVLYLSHATITTEKQLLIPEFHAPSSPWRRDDVTPTELRHHVDLSNNTHGVIEDADDTDATKEIHITRMLYLIFFTTPGYHFSIAGLHGSNFVNILRNISRWW
jgi:hypothetical protein